MTDSQQHDYRPRWAITFVLWLFLGGLGAHRFYTGHTLLGVLYLFTLGFAGLGVLFDFVALLSGQYRDSEGRPLV